MPIIGEKISFIPSGFILPGYDAARDYGQKDAQVTGTICEIYHRHRWYRVRYHVHGFTLYEGFKF